MEIKTVLITQARTNSTRLPGKILMEVEGTPLLKIHLDRLSKTKNIDKIIVATTINVHDDIIEKLVASWGYEVFRGSEDDVLDRYYQAVKNIKPTWVVRVTSDCPLIDPLLVDKVIEITQNETKDYGSNAIDQTFPDGLDIEVFTFATLSKAWKEAKLKSDREHVTQFIRRNSNLNSKNIFSAVSYNSEINYSNIRLTVDYLVDFNLIQKIISEIGADKTWQDYTNYIIDNDLLEINSKINRNEGLIKSLNNDKNG